MGCGASAEKPPANENAKKDQGKYASSKTGDELQGKNRYLGEVGSVLYVMEEKKIPVAAFIAFVAPDGRTSFSIDSSKTGKLYSAQFTDEEFTNLKTTSGMTMTFNAIFKSIVTETAKGRVKPSIREDEAQVIINVSSVKDAKKIEILNITLTPVTETPSQARINYFVEPLTRQIQKKRSQQDDKEKEFRVSRMHMQSVIWSASVQKNSTTIERASKSIVPLRTDAAQQSKATSQLQAKVEQVERRIRKLAFAGANKKHPIDGVLEDGGARYFMHLPDAEEHIPTVKNLDGSMLLDWLRESIPGKHDADLVTLTRPPSDPRVVAMMETSQGIQGQAAMRVFEKLDAWDMNVFELEEATGNNALFHVAYALMYKMDLVNHFNLDDKIMRNFLGAVQAGYHPNPYHNATHAADVAQVNYFIMIKGGVAEKCKLSKEEILAGIIAGAIHDYDHPGFNNNFHTRTNAYLSTLYNDRSILENHHCACIFEMLKLPQYDILAPLSEDQRRTVRDTVIEMVLATDMGNHAKIFSSFRRRMAEAQEWSESKTDIMLALSMSIKMADVSNCGRPKHLYLEWAKNIATEFYNQGDAEEKRKLPVSPFMDRKKDSTDFPKGQISFMNYVVVPMFEAIAEFLPPVECALQCCTENKEYWQHME